MREKSRLLTREQLATASEAAFRQTFPELPKHGPSEITERTIRFWTQQGLLPGRGRPNRAALYEPEILDRCVFIRRLQVEKALTLEDIRQVLTSVDQATVKRVADGSEPLRLEFAVNATSDPRLNPGEQLVMLRTEKEKMITAKDHHSFRRDDRPLCLQRLSDSEKERAVAAALRRVTSQEYSVDIHGIDYSGRFLDRGSFRAPVKIDCRVSCRSTTEKSAIERMRQVADTELCSAIASELSARSGERYVVELLRKRYESASAEKASLDLAFLVATANETP